MTNDVSQRPIGTKSGGPTTFEDNAQLVFFRALEDRFSRPIEYGLKKIVTLVERERDAKNFPFRSQMISFAKKRSSLMLWNF